MSSFISIGLGYLKPCLKKSDIFKMAFDEGVRSADKNEPDLPIQCPGIMAIINRFKDNHNPLTVEIVTHWRKGRMSFKG
jgi:hypothetical protein